MPKYNVTFKAQRSSGDSGITMTQNYTAGSPSEAEQKAKESPAGKGKIVTILDVKCTD
jgi:hypothetical protein